MLDEIKKRVRAVTEADRKNLPTVSYSKLDNLKKCALSHKIKYVDGYYSHSPSLATEMGSIAHKVLELKGLCKINQEPVDYEYLRAVMLNGYRSTDEKTQEELLGVKELERKYFETYGIPDNKSGMTYGEKVDVFLKDVLPDRMEDTEWEVMATEQRFEFVFDDRVILRGFIDRVDKKVDEDDLSLRIVDYKSSKAVFPDTDIKTPLQHITYDLACVFLYGVLPVDHIYDFVFINKQQTGADGVCSKGYLKRGLKKLTDLLDKMQQLEESGEFPPSPSPLCYWCPYHTDSPNADPKYKGLCRYHSLWTPDNKNFKVLNEYHPGETVKPRRIINF